MIVTGDCIEVMAGMEAESVDAIVTDPPYLLQFMGKSWDGPAQMSGHSDPTLPEGHGGQAHDHGVTGHWQPHWMQRWHEAWGREALRVTKPGGYLLAFGGTRTHHRLVCGLEDAGWIIRDELTWVYASGFPKGRANLKPAHEPIVLARKPGPLRPLGIDAGRISHNGDIANADGGGSGAGRATANIEGPAYGKGLGGIVAQPHESGRWPSNLLLSDPELFDEPNPEVVGSGAVSTVPSSYQRAEGSSHGGMFYSRPEHDADGSLGYGDTGGYSRFFIVPKSSRSDREPVVRGQLESTTAPVGSGMAGALACATCDRLISGQEWQSGVLTCGHPREAAYRPKPNAPRENLHPTCKPVDLMRHLIRLVTPTGGTVLDCFAGSGSTLIAAELEGFLWIGIEKEPEYVAIAEARLNGTQRGLGLDVGAPTKAPPKTHPDLSKHQPKRRAPHQDGTIYGGGWIGTDDEKPAA